MVVRRALQYGCCLLRHIAWQMRLRKKLSIFVFCLLLLLLLLIVLYEEPYARYEGPCPEIVWNLDSKGLSVEDGYYYDPTRVIQCGKVITGDDIEVQKAESYSGCRLLYELADEEYLHFVQDCDSYKQYQFSDYNQTKEEEEFGIAYSILMYENVFQVERLLQTIYRPQNYYCIHVDAKTSDTVYKAIENIASCFENVVLANKRIGVVYGKFSVLEAEIACLEVLWTFQKWKYFINLTGREYPIRTNWELVQVLKAYNGSNDVLGYYKKRPRSWTAVVWWAYLIPTPILKSSPPHGFRIVKGSTHIAVTREFIDYTLHSQQARDLYKWMQDIRVPDEQFFNTLSHNPHLHVPGAYKGLPDEKGFLVRYKLWRQFGDICHGQWVHGVCNYGVKDLYNLTRSPRLFANKFRMELDSVAYTCMEMWIRRRTMEGPNRSFNVSFYANQPWVKSHV